MVAIKTIVEFIIIVVALALVIFFIVINWNALKDRLIEWLKLLGGLVQIS